MLNVVLSLSIIIITVAVLVRISVVVESNGILRMTRARLAVAA